MTNNQSKPWEFDAAAATKEFNKYEKGLFCVDSWLRAARWQFDQLLAAKAIENEMLKESLSALRKIFMARFDNPNKEMGDLLLYKSAVADEALAKIESLKRGEK
jgi:hypothetical protein